MPIIRQGSLFGLQELYDLEPTHRFEAIFSTIDMEPIFAVVTKKSRFGRPVELNYVAMIYSLVARITERIPFIKDLVKRLNNDMIFRLGCGFLVSDSVPSEAAYSRMVTLLSESDALEKAKGSLLYQAITEGFITDDTVALDATHFKAKDQAPPKQEKPEIEFEEYLEVLFKKLGYKVKRTKASNDYGADLILYGDRRIAIQAKRYNKTVGVKAVQEVNSARQYYNTTYAWVITNNYFSSNAVNLASVANVKIN